MREAFATIRSSFRIWPFYSLSHLFGKYVAQRRSIGQSLRLQIWVSHRIPSWVFTGLSKKTDGKYTAKWINTNSSTTHNTNIHDNDDSNDDNPRRSVPNLREAFDITRGWFRFGWDESAYRLRIDATSHSKLEYDYIGYWYRRVYAILACMVLLHRWSRGTEIRQWYL